MNIASMFSGNGNSYVCELSSEVIERIEGVFKSLYGATNDLSLYASAQVERQMIELVSITVVDEFISEFSIADGESVTITVKYKNTVFYINVTNFPQSSMMTGISYNIEY